MPWCAGGKNKVSPDHVSSKEESEVVGHACKRNGWSCPWHPFQLLAWLFLLFFGLAYFGVMVTYLPTDWEASGYLIPGSIFVVHLIFHVMCVSVDPADNAVRNSKINKLPFDRGKRPHVIENCHCYICQTYVQKSSKHCSICNKCISGFDHHCKWLNNCIGSRNYKLFLGCVLSAFVGALVLFIITTYQFAMLFHNPAALLSYAGSDRWQIFVAASKPAFIAFLSVIGLLLLLAIGLLAHLIVFHIYLIKHGMTTYDYIVQLREKSVATDRLDASDIELARSHTPPSFQVGAAVVADGNQSHNEASQRHCSRQGRLDHTESQQLNEGYYKEKQSADDAEAMLQVESNHNVIVADTPAGTTASPQYAKRPCSSEKENSRSDSEESLPEVPSEREATMHRFTPVDLFSATIALERDRSELLICRSTAGRPLPHYNAGSPLSRAKRKERCFADRQTVERSSFKNSESKSELISRENSKKRRMKKNKGKLKGAVRELPPLVGKGRPLPKLATLDEERDYLTEC